MNQLPLRRPVTKIGSMLLAFVLAVIGAIAFTSYTVQAAEIPNDGTYGIKQVSPESTTWEQWGSIRLNFTWAAPNGTRQGDTLAITLPDVIDASTAAGFTVTSPSGEEIGKATFDSAANKMVITFSTNYVETHHNVKGTAYFNANLRQSALVFDSTTNTMKVNVFGTGVTINKLVGPYGPETEAKQGWWIPSQAEATATNDSGVLIHKGEAAINYAVILDNLGWSTATINDKADADLVYCVNGQAAPGTFTYIQTRDIEYGVFDTVQVPQGVNVTASCEGITSGAPKITVTKSASLREKQFRIVYGMKLRTNSKGQPVHGAKDTVGVKKRYLNTADISYDTGKKTLKLTSRLSLEEGGGNGSGINAPAIDIEKYDGTWEGVQWNEAGEPNVSEEPDYEPNNLPAGDRDSAPGLSLAANEGATVKFTVSNVGIEDLTNVVVTDKTTNGPALKNVQCVVEGKTHKANPNGEVDLGTWVFPKKASFTCQGTLDPMGGKVTHSDNAKVAAVSVTSRTPVEDSDPWHATSRPTPKVSVGDYVWFDQNKNGIQDKGEPGIEGVTLTLVGPNGKEVNDVDGNAVTPVKTNADGAYNFKNLPVLPAGKHYTVKVTAPKGYEPTKAEAGADRAKDSSTGQAESGDLTADGQRDATLDFGFVKSEPPVTPKPTPTPTVTQSTPPTPSTPPGTPSTPPTAPTPPSSTPSTPPTAPTPPASTPPAPPSKPATPPAASTSTPAITSTDPARPRTKGPRKHLAFTGLDGTFMSLSALALLATGGAIVAVKRRSNSK